MSALQRKTVAPRQASTVHKIVIEINRVFKRYVLCGGDKIRYLRKVGVQIGNGCEIITDAGNFGTEPWLIEIGNMVTVASGVLFLTHDGASRVFRYSVPNIGSYFGTIVIDDNSFIGANSILLPNVRIGSNSIVGAGSIVTSEVPSNTVAAGAPAREICTLSDYIEKYKARMMITASQNRTELRRELTQHFWGEYR